MKILFLLLTSFSFPLILCKYYSYELETGKRNLQKNSTKRKTTTLCMIEEEQKYTVLNLDNHYNYYYYGRIYIGDKRQEFKINFDTGSRLLFVPSYNCKGCPNNSNKYIPYYSKYFKNLYQKDSIKYIDGAKVQGEYYSDMISLKPRGRFNLIAMDVIFLSVFEAQNLINDENDGLMGLGIDNKGDSSKSFIETLYYQNQIQSPAFSFYLLGTQNISRLYIGDIINNVYISDLFKGHIHECFVPEGEKNWFCQINKNIKLKKNKKNKTFITNSKFLFDTGTSYTNIPEKDFNVLIKFLNREHECSVDENDCLNCKLSQKEKFGVLIELNFDENNKFEINLDNMKKYIEEKKYNCFLGIFSCSYEYIYHFQIKKISTEDCWTLGDSSLRNNLISFNILERKISFVQNISNIINDRKIENSKWVGNIFNKLYTYRLFRFFYNNFLMILLIILLIIFIILYNLF